MRPRAPRGLIMSHPTLNENVRAASAALVSAGLVGEFHTTIETSRVPEVVVRRFPVLRGRRVSANVASVMKVHPLREALRLLARDHSVLRRIFGRTDIDEVYADLDRRVASVVRRHRLGVYAYEDGALR